MKQTINIPKEIYHKIILIGNKTKIQSAIKIYNGLERKSKYKNKEGYFQVPSRYLRSINSRYNEIIDFLIDNNLIETLKREILPCEQGGDLFNTIHKVTYSVKNSISIHYRFNSNIDFSDVYPIEININNRTEDKKWFKTIKNSLERLGYTGKISRDNFGGRVYHELTPIYKEELSGKGFFTIDAITSQPRLLYLMMKKKGVVDKKYFNIFENDLDFYLELKLELGLEDRKESKDIFMFWALGSGYTKGYNLNVIFPEASRFLRSLKGKNYKDSSRCLSRNESMIWIDDLLENIPVKFAIPIHDSFIIMKNDIHKVLQYCKDKYPEIKFDVKEL